MSIAKTQFMKDEYPNSKADLFAAFIERCTVLAGPSGIAAMITMQSWMFLSSYEKLRASLLTNQHITSMLHLGTRAFDSIGGEVVSSVAFVLQNQPTRSQGTVATGTGIFIRLVEGSSEAEKVEALRRILADCYPLSGYYLVSADDFKAIPGSPIAYWLSEKIRTAFKEYPALETRSRSAIGMITGRNATYVRQWWEISSDQMVSGAASRSAAKASGRKWFPYAKGGEFRRWAGNTESVVDWHRDGERLQNTLAPGGGRVWAHNFNLDRIFQPGLAWTVVTSGEQSFRLVPAGSLFDAAAGMCQSVTDEVHLAILNSGVSSLLLSSINPTLNLHPGYLGAVPVPENADHFAVDGVARLVRRSKEDWDSFETSCNFEANPLLAIDCSEMQD